MQMVGEEFLDRLDFYQSSWLPARAVVEEAVKKRHEVNDRLLSVATDKHCLIAACVRDTSTLILH